MSFQDKYKILSPLSAGESASFRALQTDTRRPVLVHWLAASKTLPGQPDVAFLIFRFLRSTTAQENRFLLDMGEDEGRVYVVTADVLECRDLRKWLQAVADTHDGQFQRASAPAGAPPDSVNLDFTRTFTSEALRHVSQILTGSAASRSEGSGSRAKETDQTGKSYPISADLNDTGARDFTAFWEKYYPESLDEKHTPKSPAAVPSETGGEGSTSKPLISDRATNQKPGTDAAKPQPPPSADKKPGTTDPATRIPTLLADLVREDLQGHLPVSGAPPVVDGQAGDDSADKAPRKPLPGRFEVVFQSNKPRNRPTLLGVANQPEQMIAEPGSSPPRAAAHLNAALPSNPAQVADSQNANKQAGAAVVSTPRVEGQSSSPGPASDILKFLAQPLPSTPNQHSSEESEKPTRLVPDAPHSRASTPAEPTPAEPTPASLSTPSSSSTATPSAGEASAANLRKPSPPGNSLGLPEVQAEAISAPGPILPSRAQPGEYTRMTESLRSLAGPLPPETLSASSVLWPDAENAPSKSSPGPATSFGTSATRLVGQVGSPAKFEPPRYIPNDRPPESGAKKRSAWVSIVIFSSLFLMTVGLLLYFAGRH